ncbi:MAG: ArsR family transcriptional regulator [Microlunatus sp.]|nr:ArsR family transcriptional regulator [Microlunatus sp.]
MADAELPILSESRSRVLEVLQSESPLGVGQVAEGLGLHPNTVRVHPDALVDSGLASRSMEQRGGPGRPRTLYAAAAGSVRTGRRSCQLLAQILTSYIAGRVEQPAEAAREAGEAWGRYLARPRAPFQRFGAEAATRRLVELLQDVGFAPELGEVDDGGGEVGAGLKDRRVLLHHCPFRELAEQHQSVVCSIHLGLMRGMLAELQAPVAAGRLEPFVTPSLCVAHVIESTDAADRTASSLR